MDGIVNLRCVNTWDYVQQNQLCSGQGDEVDKVFIFKMFEFVPKNGFDLVRRMQNVMDLEHAWSMSDHVKRMAKWL